MEILKKKGKELFRDYAIILNFLWCLLHLTTIVGGKKRTLERAFSINVHTAPKKKIHRPYVRL